eukprot:TRINITY_DN3179_c0_g2_i14.p1 TRINITY_DN3179_c0_g2~~TRINITY_DN3179_c0_g2_i14.p1  ORF type:complete len:243 (-),score=46.31 TRINITY_DN3179_c0_g2_i14:266-994(-)
MAKISNADRLQQEKLSQNSFQQSYQQSHYQQVHPIPFQQSHQKSHQELHKQPIPQQEVMYQHKNHLYHGQSNQEWQSQYSQFHQAKFYCQRSLHQSVQSHQPYLPRTTLQESSDQQSFQSEIHQKSAPQYIQQPFQSQQHSHSFQQQSQHIFQPLHQFISQPHSQFYIFSQSFQEAHQNPFQLLYKQPSDGFQPTSPSCKTFNQENRKRDILIPSFDELLSTIHQNEKILWDSDCNLSSSED